MCFINVSVDKTTYSIYMKRQFLGFLLHQIVYKHQLGEVEK